MQGTSRILETIQYQNLSLKYIEDCLKGTQMIMENDEIDFPINLGSAEKVSINQLIEIVEDIAKIKLEKNYQLEKPQGVKGRSSNNDLIKKVLKWDYKFSLKSGIEQTYNWIENIYLNQKNLENSRFTKK